MRSRRKRLLTGAAAAILAAGAIWGLGAPVRAASEPDLTPEEEAIGGWMDHAGCTLFGPERDKYMRVGLAAETAAAEKRSALTIGVVNQLKPLRSPLRGRSHRPATPPTGPISGDSIDDFIFGTLERQRIAPAPPTTDAEFLRRVTIDLIGRIPTQDEAIQFLTDGSSDKRTNLVNTLLADSRWADRWAMFYGDLFRNTQVTAQVNRYPGGRDSLHLFLRESLRANRPYDQIARDLISASGVADGRPWPNSFSRTSPFATYEDYIGFLNNTPATASAASYIVGGRTGGGPIHDTYDTLAVNATRDFLGITHMDCILCHDGVGHLESLNAWGVAAKRADAWGMSAFFRSVWLRRPSYFAPPRNGQTRGPRPPYWVVVNAAREIRNQRGNLVAGAYTLDTTGGNRPERASDSATEAYPWYFFTNAGPNGGESDQQALARLLTADKQFARAAVNYIWAELFGRGIVDPPGQFDLLRMTSNVLPDDSWDVQPSHPELLEWLADKFVENGFNLKWLMAEIVNSDAYQLSSRYDGAWSPTYDRYLARHQVQRLGAEALYDSITIATATPLQFPLPRQTRTSLGNLTFALQLPDVQNMPANARNNPAGGLTIQFLDAFFRGDREESPRSSEVSILQALHSMNNELVLQRIRASADQSALGALLDQDDQTLVGLLYVRVLGRFADPDELSQGVAYMQGGDRRERAEDLMWTLMNKVDFVFNY